MINNQAFYRRDITEGKSGLPLTLTLTVVNTNNGCSAISGVQVEVWQCDATGNYSEYSQPGDDGLRQIGYWPGSIARARPCAQVIGRSQAARRIHVDVYRSGTMVKTTQIAFPESISAAVYASGVYASKGQSPTRASDNVFRRRDQRAGHGHGSNDERYTATLNIGIAL
jgi:protocatechuate 3,4-dioxygenase beta subunit